MDDYDTTAEPRPAIAPDAESRNGGRHAADHPEHSAPPARDPSPAAAATATMDTYGPDGFPAPDRQPQPQPRRMDTHQPDDDQPDESRVADVMRWTGSKLTDAAHWTIAHWQILGTVLAVFLGYMNATWSGVKLFTTWFGLDMGPLAVTLALALPSAMVTLTAIAVHQLYYEHATAKTMTRWMCVITLATMLIDLAAAFASHADLVRGAFAVLWPLAAVAAYLVYTGTLRAVRSALQL